MTLNEINFLIDQFIKITDNKALEDPIEYIESVRYLPAELTPFPGYYKFSVAPFWREPFYEMSPFSDTQKIAIVKGVQQMATTSCIENPIAYYIGCNPRPMLYITADKNLIEKSFETKIERLLDSCNLRDRIFSQTAKAKNTGDTKLRKEYAGGFLDGITAGSGGALRSMSYPIIFMDELDAFADTIGNEGDPVSIADNRSNAYADSGRKIIYISTPLVTQTSKIWKLFLAGDQRYYFVPCTKCGMMQVLKWHVTNDNGEKCGIVYDVIKNNEGKFVPDYKTVGYKCINPECGHVMKNNDKQAMFEKGEWRPTAQAVEPKLKSYQISAIYSPVGFFSWESVVAKWASCIDLETNRIKDFEKYREFRNLIQGLPIDIAEGEAVRYEKVMKNKRAYMSGKINNQIALEDTGSPILFLTSSVDVQKRSIYFDLKGWTAGGRCYTIEFRQIEGETEDINSPVWKELDELIMHGRWISDDNKEYHILNTVIDSGHYTKYVYEFCKNYSSGVFAIKGKEALKYGLLYKEFSKASLENAGLPVAYLVNTDKLKDLFVSRINLIWESEKLQPEWYMNFPDDFHDEYFKMFESETKVVEKDKFGRFLRSIWKPVSSNAENHAFDTFVYNIVNLEMLANYYCRSEEFLNLDTVDWSKFWEFAEKGYFYRDIK